MVWTLIVDAGMVETDSADVDSKARSVEVAVELRGFVVVAAVVEVAVVVAAVAVELAAFGVG